jgi:hypothetical protein
MSNSNRPHRPAAETRAASWQLRPQLLSDAVVAGYIHDTSARHGQHRALPVWSYERVRQPTRTQAAA